MWWVPGIYSLCIFWEFNTVLWTTVIKPVHEISGLIHCAFPLLAWFSFHKSNRKESLFNSPFIRSDFSPLENVTANNSHVFQPKVQKKKKDSVCEKLKNCHITKTIFCCKQLSVSPGRFFGGWRETCGLCDVREDGCYRVIGPDGLFVGALVSPDSHCFLSSIRTWHVAGVGGSDVTGSS